MEQNIVFPALLDYQKPDMKYLEELLTVLNLKERRRPSSQSAFRRPAAVRGNRTRFNDTSGADNFADEPTGNLDTQKYK